MHAQVNETVTRAHSVDRDLRATVSELSLYRTAAQQLQASHVLLQQQVASCAALTLSCPLASQRVTIRSGLLEQVQTACQHRWTGIGGNRASAAPGRGLSRVKALCAAQVQDAEARMEEGKEPVAGWDRDWDLHQHASRERSIQRQVRTHALRQAHALPRGLQDPSWMHASLPCLHVWRLSFVPLPALPMQN